MLLNCALGTFVVLCTGASADKHAVKAQNVKHEIYLGQLRWHVIPGLGSWWEWRSRTTMGLMGLLTVCFLFSSLHSFLQPPKPLSSLSTLRDGNWRDGCYWCSLMFLWRMGKKWKWGLCYLAGWVTVDTGIFFPVCILMYLLNCFSRTKHQRLIIALKYLPEILQHSQIHGCSIVTLRSRKFL